MEPILILKSYERQGEEHEAASVFILSDGTHISTHEISTQSDYSLPTSDT